jgi:hypothetical protein
MKVYFGERTERAPTFMDNSSTPVGVRVVAILQRMVREQSIVRSVSMEDTLAEPG